MADSTRRIFLKRGAGAVLSLMVPSIVSRCADDTKSKDKDLLADLAGGDVGTDLGLDSAGVPDTTVDVAADAAEIVAADPRAVHAILGSDLKELCAMGKQAAQAVGIVEGAMTGKTVFIKPNFVALGMEMFGVGYDPTTGEITKPEILVGVAEQCLIAGASKVTIGEGAQTIKWDWSTVTFLPGTSIDGATNLLEAVDALNLKYGAGKVELLCVNEADDWVLIPSASTSENTKDGIYLSRAFCEADHAITVPVIKTHQWAMVTASVKNYFGLASINHHGNGVSRCKLHLAYADVECHGVAEAGVSGSFVDIHKYRMDQGRQDFSIIDGSICLEGSGPHKAPINDGRTMHMKDRNAAGKYFLLASRDLVAADATVADILNIKRTDVKALRMFENLGMNAMADVPMVGSSVADLKVADWMPPEIKPESYFESVCK